MTPASHSGVEKSNDDGKRHYFSSNRYDAAAEIVPLEKREVNLTQNGLPQFQDLYHLPLLPRCRVTAFVYLKVLIWHEYLHKRQIRSIVHE